MSVLWDEASATREVIQWLPGDRIRPFTPHRA